MSLNADSQWKRTCLSTRFRPCAIVLLTLMLPSSALAQRGENALEQRIDRIAQEAVQSDLRRFESDARFDRYVSRLRPLLDRRERLARQRVRSIARVASASAPSNQVTESITNNQEAGVDEGGIVKAHGDFLVVLRRGRLFSMRAGTDALQPISAVDVISEGRGWFDEMLLHDGTIVVVGYRYDVGASEFRIFDMDSAGRISYRNTLQIQGSDYYSSRNYASRLIDGTLVFYTPQPLFVARRVRGSFRYQARLPGYRVGEASEWTPLMRGRDIYRPVQKVLAPTLHTVVRCELDSASMPCRADGVLGPRGRNFYVSRDAVWLWVSGRYVRPGSAQTSASSAVAYRLPMRASELPGALGVWGTPVDQFSFRQGADGHLNVLVRAYGDGDAMWSPEFSGGRVALLRVPVSAFTSGVGQASSQAYRFLPRVANEGPFHNRFVGDHVLYGTGTRWRREPQTGARQVFVYPYTRGRAAQATPLSLEHAIDRIEVMGNASVVIGADGQDLHFSAIGLNVTPRVVGHYVQFNATQGDRRSHGFFYRAQADGDGMLALPIVSGFQGRGRTNSQHGSAQMMFLRVRQERAFFPVGRLVADETPVDDHCRVSCMDWYGNARPIFYRGRIFGLMGYELVEGQMRAGRLRELRRASFLDALRLDG